MLLVSLASQLGVHHRCDRSLLVSIMLQDQLLQPQERPFMRNLLSDLYTSLPSVLRRQSRTCWTLTSVDDKREDECLLQDGIGQNFLLDSDLDFDSSRMGFCPDI